MAFEVFFEHLAKPDRVEGVAHLLLRRNKLEPRVLVLCPDDAFCKALDQRLWTIHPESFLAHGVAGGENDDDHPILLSTDVAHLGGIKVLINGGLEVPTDLSSVEKVVDFVDGWDDRLKQISRDRFRTYKSFGVQPGYIGEGKG